jgi:hypothetical protein
MDVERALAQWGPNPVRPGNNTYRLLAARISEKIEKYSRNPLKDRPLTRPCPERGRPTTETPGSRDRRPLLKAQNPKLLAGAASPADLSTAGSGGAVEDQGAPGLQQLRPQEAISK